jgi:hypothetical protein
VLAPRDPSPSKAELRHTQSGVDTNPLERSQGGNPIFGEAPEDAACISSAQRISQGTGFAAGTDVGAEPEIVNQ